MKKFLLTLVAVATFGAANAQLGISAQGAYSTIEYAVAVSDGYNFVAVAGEADGFGGVVAIDYDFAGDEGIILAPTASLFIGSGDTAFSAGVEAGLEAIHAKVDYDFSAKGFLWGAGSNVALSEGLDITGAVQYQSVKDSGYDSYSGLGAAAEVEGFIFSLGLRLNL